MTETKKFYQHALFWVPSLYLAMGIPYNVVNGTASTMYKALGFQDAQITGALGSITLVWSLKPLWAAFLDMYKTKKFFVLSMELALAIFFGVVAMLLPLPHFFQYSIMALWIAAFASSTQDICGDGIYLTALDKPTQASFAGIQGTAWNLGKILSTGMLIAAMETISKAQGWSSQTMWINIWLVLAGSMTVFFLYHLYFLPAGNIAHRPHNAEQVWKDFWATAITFFHKRAFWGMIAFVLLYRLGEGLLIVEGKLFLQSATEKGGLGLSPGQAGTIDATWGTAAAIIGGLIGGVFLGKVGLRKSLPFLGLCLNIPHFTFVYLSHKAAAGHGLDYSTITILVVIEKFGYGFGFIGNMVYMMQQLAPGRWTMAHYAFATAIMNFILSTTIMISGPLADTLGYSTFFIAVMFASVPSIWAAWQAPFPLSTEGAVQPSTDKESQVVITLDDPTRLTETEKTVQKLAGQASMLAVINILIVLIVDSTFYGWMHAATHGTEMDFLPKILLKLTSLLGGGAIPATQVFFALMVISAAIKLWFSIRCFNQAKIAASAADIQNEQVYRRNARGAKIATVACLAATVAILAFGYKQAF